MKIISAAPTRISLFGGGTDVEPYVSRFGGLCINMAINIRQHVILYSGEDLAEHPYTTCPGDPNFFYTILDEFGINGTHHSSIKAEFDGIIESGLGSSAAAAVALVGTISKRLGLHLTLDQIAEKAWDIEVNKFGLYGGKQDQYAAVYGGVNVMEFKSSGGVVVIPLARGFIEPIIPSLVLFYTGENRKSAKIQEGFKELTIQQIEALHKIKALAIESVGPIGQGNITRVGKLLDFAWELKKTSNKGVSNEKIDNIYTYAKEQGALGGKVLGAGGGGFMLFVIPPKKKKAFIQAMEEMGLEWWDFEVDWTGLTTRVIPKGWF